MSSIFYVLDEGGEPIPAPDIRQFGEWFENSDRTVLRERIGRYLVSTVFLAIDHNYTGEGEPVLWETMVFLWHTSRSLDMTRCAGRRAEAMHAQMVAKVRAAIKKYGKFLGTLQ